ncbi:MAG TPA: hypothetical protein VK436_09950, partial [Methanocella sp.]|nr:hypothetical protein [Methanocella sp.]
MEDIIEIKINGSSLINIIRETESRQSEPRNYEGLSVLTSLYPSKHLLDDPHPYYPAKYGGRIPVLRCVCGDLDCNPMYVKISVTDKDITWSDFFNPWETTEWRSNPVDYSSLRFVFEKSQYESEL